MAIKKYKPTTPGRRGMSTLVNEEITTNLEVVSKLDNISLIKAQTFCNNKMIVECQMKIFIKM